MNGGLAIVVGHFVSLPSAERDTVSDSLHVLFVRIWRVLFIFEMKCDYRKTNFIIDEIKDNAFLRSIRLSFHPQIWDYNGSLRSVWISGEQTIMFPGKESSQHNKSLCKQSQYCWDCGLDGGSRSDAGYKDISQIYHRTARGVLTPM